MNTAELNSFVKSLGISQEQILREEAEMKILDVLSKNKLGQKIVFYGGTALRLSYGSPRFSEDIDLLAIKTVQYTEFEDFINDILRVNTKGWQLRDIKKKRNTLFALFMINDENLKHNYSVKIEIHVPAKKPFIETQLLLIKSPVSILEPLLLAPTIKELKRLKENALMGRKKARDLFDLWYIAQSMREPFVLPKKRPVFSKREFTNELQVFLPKNYYPVIKQLYEQTIETD